jgi:hypothetical protein
MKSHRQHSLNYLKCDTVAKQKEIERQHGCRYSVLLELPYYKVIRFCIVDPMHNLLLGTVKHILSVWTSTGVIDKKQYLEIKEKVDNSL